MHGALGMGSGAIPVVIGGDPVAFTVSVYSVHVYVAVNWSTFVGVTCGPVGVYGGLSLDTMVGVVYGAKVSTAVGEEASVGMVVEVAGTIVREGP
jgi:hypothetical protein